jgi:hypothetical protein
MEKSQLRLEWLDPKNLKPNPMNYRMHPEQQKKILAAVIGEVGWAGALLYNEKTGNLIDGHARQEEAIERGESSVPVLIGSWDEPDERKILATLDPISEMAQRSDDAYRELLGSLNVENDDLTAWVDGAIGLLSSQGEDDDLGNIPDSPKSSNGGDNLECCPKCGFQWKK